MEPLDPALLPPPLRLALGYAAPDSRPAIAAVFALDSRLARAGAEASEPIIAQMKLAWWRDQFAKPAADWPRGEPLLAEICALGLEPDRLLGLVDGWEAIITAEALDVPALQAFSAGRAAAWLAVAETLGQESHADAVLAAGRMWALGDLGSHLDPGARELVRSIDPDELPGIPSLPRSLRPFQVLAALGRRATARGRPLLDGAAALALALRVGISGR